LIIGGQLTSLVGSHVVVSEIAGNGDSWSGDEGVSSTSFQSVTIFCMGATQ
jgi:hypothetical protein